MARQFGCAHCPATITVEHLEAGEWKKEAECPECGEYSVVPEGDATATPGKQAKRDMFEGAGSTPAGTEPRSVSSTPTGQITGSYVVIDGEEYQLASLWERWWAQFLDGLVYLALAFGPLLLWFCCLLILGVLGILAERTTGSIFFFYGSVALVFVIGILLPLAYLHA